MRYREEIFEQSHSLLNIKMLSLDSYRKTNTITSEFFIYHRTIFQPRKKSNHEATTSAAFIASLFLILQMKWWLSSNQTAQ